MLLGSLTCIEISQNAAVPTRSDLGRGYVAYFRSIAPSASARKGLPPRLLWQRLALLRGARHGWEIAARSHARAEAKREGPQRIFPRRRHRCPVRDITRCRPQGRRAVREVDLSVRLSLHHRVRTSAPHPRAIVPRSVGRGHCLE